MSRPSGVRLTASLHPEENISIETLLKAGWQIAGYTSTLDSRSAFILFRKPDETYLVQCRASYDVTRTPSAPTRTATSSSSSQPALASILELDQALN